MFYDFIQCTLTYAQYFPSQKILSNELLLSLLFHTHLVPRKWKTLHAFCNTELKKKSLNLHIGVLCINTSNFTSVFNNVFRMAVTNIYISYILRFSLFGRNYA